LVVAELLSLGNDSPNGLVPHSGNMHDLLLALELLGCSGCLLGQKGRVPGCSDVDIDFLPAVVLAGLLLLRKLPLVLLLVVLTLMLVLVTLLELLRWVA
jgi:hypothetical protein